MTTPAEGCAGLWSRGSGGFSDRSKDHLRVNVGRAHAQSRTDSQGAGAHSRGISFGQGCA